MPANTRARLIMELKQSGEEDTYEDKNGKTRKKIIKFVPVQRLMKFPPGFYFDCIIADECHTIRNPYTGFSRLIRLMVRAAHKGRTEEDCLENPASLILVSATPAINKITDCRGLSSLI